jgi:antibiotic biosynthesis monooxygenase (ABM) superfamily enzyme
VTRTERRTGIEGWFDVPVAGEVVTPSTARSAPPRWKQATIWLVFFRLSLLTTVTLGELLAPLPIVARVALTTLLLTPVMTYLVLPWVTARLGWWLHGRSWRDRRQPRG